MREQLIHYVDLLFAGVPDARDMKQEILQNTLDRYDDLIGQGKTPEAAYSLAISGIGDISEILGSPQAADTPAEYSEQEEPEAVPTWKKVLRAISVCLYIMCPIPLFVLGDVLGLCGLLTFVAVATSLQIFAGGKGKHQKTEKKESTKSDVAKAVESIIWTVGLCAYFALSFATQAWYITWVIFPMLAAIQGIANGFFDLKKKTGSAVTRIVIYSLVALLLLGLLGAGIGAGMLSFHLSFDKGDYNVGSGSVAADQVHSIKVEWVDGDITLKPGDTDQITFTDSGSSRYETVWEQSGDQLTICYTKSSFSVGFFSYPEKDLEIIVPMQWYCDELEIETVSGSVYISDLSAQEISVEGVSAKCVMEGCSADSVTCTTVSGDVEYSGSLNTLDCESVSAKCTVTAVNAPSSVDMDCVSGDMILYLPEDTGFSVTTDSLSGSFSSDFNTVSENGRYVYGDGQCKINADAVSGNVRILKGN